MRKSLLSILVLSAGALIADDIMQVERPDILPPPYIISANPEYAHTIFPRFFFKKHKEGGYNYDMFGLELGYSYKKPEGLNFKCSISTNLDGSRPYVEEDAFIAYSFKANDDIFLFPYIASKNATHQIQKVDDVKYIVSKGSLYCGLGMRPTILDSVDTELKIGLSRDLYNILLHSTEDKFIGRKFSNPFGYIAQLSVGHHTIDKLYISIDGSFARGFKGEFQSFGAGLSANWGF